MKRILGLVAVLVVGGSAFAQTADLPKLVDMTAASGIEFELACGSRQKLYIHEAMCGGVAVFDFDNDGWLDIFFLNGSSPDPKKPAASKLYRNLKNGKFEDVTAGSGLQQHEWGMGLAVGDIDNDGWRDLYITTVTGGVLYRNDGGKFQDITEKAGAGNPGRWGTSAAFGDYDGDGFLDLYIANYVDLDLNNLPKFGSGPFCQYRGIPVSCGPRGLKGSRDRLYRNKGDGTFAEVSEQLGIDPEGYYGLGVVWGDYDGDGDADVYVANDSSPSLLYRNDGNGKFTEGGVTAGVAYSADGREQAGMGVDMEDYDNDARLDIVKTNFSDDTNNLYRNEGDGSFTDVAGGAGFGPISIPFLAFGVRFVDLDNDGLKDIPVANGHVNPQVDEHAFGVSYAQPNHLFRNLGGGKFAEVGAQTGPAIGQKAVSRGLAAGDLDNDGDYDLVITNLDGRAQVLRNDGGNRNKWVRLVLAGRRSNRDGLGARVEVSLGQSRQVYEVRANSSYLAASDARVLIGLGEASKADRIRVRWPAGSESVLENVGAGEEVRVEEAVPGEGARPPQNRTPGSGASGRGPLPVPRIPVSAPGTAGTLDKGRAK